MHALSIEKELPLNGILLGPAVLAMVMILGAGAAYAGADTAFDTALTKFTKFLEGSRGKIITVMSLAGIVALAPGRFSLGQVAVPVAVGGRCRQRRADRHRDDLRSDPWRQGDLAYGSAQHSVASR